LQSESESLQETVNRLEAENVPAGEIKKAKGQSSKVKAIVGNLERMQEKLQTLADDITDAAYVIESAGGDLSTAAETLEGIEQGG